VDEDVFRFMKLVKFGSVLTHSQIDAIPRTVLRATFDAALMSSDPSDPFSALESSGVIGYVLPNLQKIVKFGGNGHKRLWPHTLQVVSQCPKSLFVRWAALYHDVGKPHTIKRVGKIVSFHNHEVVSAHLFVSDTRVAGLFFNRSERNYVANLIKLLGKFEAYDKTWTNSGIRRLMRDAGDSWRDMISLAQADVTSVNPRIRTHVAVSISELSHRAQTIRLEDANERAVRLPKGVGNFVSQGCNVSGRELGNIMRKIQDAVKKNEITNDHAAEWYVSWYKENHC